MTNWDILSAIGAVLAGLGAIATALVAWRQLHNLNQTLRMNALTVVLQLESEMNARKAKVEEKSTQIRVESLNETDNEKLVAILNDELKGYLENWINSADRLAFCISRGYLSERDWKREYRDYFNQLVKDRPEMFGVDSIYTNIIDLNNKWKRE